jgi:hypothetical protein
MRFNKPEVVPIRINESIKGCKYDRDETNKLQARVIGLTTTGRKRLILLCQFLLSVCQCSLVFCCPCCSPCLAGFHMDTVFSQRSHYVVESDQTADQTKVSFGQRSTTETCFVSPWPNGIQRTCALCVFDIAENCS